MEKRTKRVIWIAALMMLFVVISGKVKAKAEDIWIQWGEEYYFEGDGNSDDIYYFTLDQLSKVTINIDSRHSLYLYMGKVNLYTNEKIPLGTAWIKEGKNIVTVTLGEGCYYLHPETYCTGRIIYEPCNSDTEEIESNDTFDTAQEIKTNILYEGNYYGDKDEDYYKIVLTEPGLIWFESFGRAKTTLYMEDEYLNTYDIISIQSENGEYCNSNRIVLSKGTYYINIQGYDNASWIMGYSYKFKINYEKIDTTSSELEPNNTLQVAAAIETNKTYTGNSETPEDIDYYKFSLTQTSKVQLRFDQPRGTAAENYFIELLQYDEDSEVESRLDKMTTTSNPVTFGEEVILEAGDYYVKVTGQKADSFVDYKLKVNAEKYILVEEISLATSTKTFNTGTNFTLKASVSPVDAIDRTVTWSSSDETVATVDKSGKVKCLKPGECYIYARANDASEEVGRYHLIVGKSKVNTLKKVTVSAGELSPAFESSKKSYKILLDKDTSKVTIKWTRSSSYAKTYVNDKEVSKTTVSLKAGQKKTVKVVVVSENGDERTYKFVVERAYK